MEVINIRQKFSLFSDHWNPKVIAALNGQHVKLAKLKGQFVWHSHPEEDELFFVISGSLTIEFRDRKLVVGSGEMLVVPRGTEHRPVAHDEVELLLFEPAQTKHTGDTKHDITVEEFKWI